MIAGKKIYLLIFLFAIETICVTYALSVPQIAAITSLLYFFSGLFIAFVMIGLNEAQLSFNIKKINGIGFVYRVIALLITTVVIVYFCRKWMSDAPMDYHDADMLPIIKIMNRRLINGQRLYVYDTIPEIWKGIQPVYLPAMWMPFGIPTLLNIDLRWLTAVCLVVVFSFFIFLFKPENKKGGFVLLSAFTLLWWLLTQEDASGLIPYTEEGIIIFYYTLLTIALLNKNIWLTGISISLCVLSRYALIGFLPPFILIMLLQKNYKQFSKLAVTGIVCLLFLLIIPFGWNVLGKLLALPNEYISFAARVWHDAPHVFTNGLGLAKFFGEEHITLQHQLLIALTFIIPFIFAMVCFWLKQKGKHINNISLATLKISLVIFYNFIDVPYLYLFYTSSFVSLLAVSYFVSNRNISKVL
jgi:hypothetical protein